MKQKSSLILGKEFIQYCELNNIDDVEKLAKDTFNRGFTILKYGETPFGKQQTKEVIKEVEKIVEVIKEVPVEKIIEVTKEVYNNDEIDKLKKENEDLRNELDKITNSLSNLGKGKMMRNSNMGSLYDE